MDAIQGAAVAPVSPDRRVPTRAEAVVFAAKAWLLRGRRALADLSPGAPRRLSPGTVLREMPTIATVTLSLRSGGDDAESRLLDEGKIHNLCVAIGGIDGIEVPEDTVFSFWRQVGRPVRRRGFVPGRELREGCMIAAVGGGLCQLSNALYEAALDAGLTVVERHAHTRIVPGSRAEAGRDATVFWNYVDLRLRAAHPFRIEARITADALELRLRGTRATPVAPAARRIDEPALHDCLTCGQTTCHRHRAVQP